MIDFYGSGFDIAERMGIVEQLREKHYYIPKLVFVDGNGRRRAELDVQKFRKSLGFRHYNFMRGDLASVLYDNKPADCEVIFGQSISAICLTRNKVGVNLQNGDRFEFDLLIGADGIHSQVRKLLWGDESRYSRFLGHYVACSVIENFLEDDDTFYSYFEPGRQAAVYPIRGNKLATFFIFPCNEPRVMIKEEQLQLLDHHFSSMGWIVPQWLDRAKKASRFYFDAVSQIELTLWYQNRVVLLGDARHCLTLLAGQGASMAMAGAYIFAEEFMKANQDYEQAFRAYQNRLKPEVEDRQRQARKMTNSFVPKNYFSIWLTNLFLKVAFLPGFNRVLLHRIGAESVI